ncbi:MAG: LysR family transcriptional regulator [Desulfitobacteriaceae bacterium]|nr:LysR family transcriptional regulator [Desulfitobacteriaceae bacterium]MDD4752168.1 LysR family transcriptional regulator [Desulfitobacteriaceae bacterium]
MYLIDKLGSLNKAAKELHMSYSHAWNLIKILEKRLGFKLLQREVGGNSGGGSFLTKDACELMKKYELFMQEADSSLKLLFQKYFG